MVLPTLTRGIIFLSHLWFGGGTLAGSNELNSERLDCKCKVYHS